MTPISRSTKGGQAYLDLQKQARILGLNTDQLLVRYVLERFLYRITQTAWRGRLILKGGMLLAAFDVRRPTQDVDMAARAVEANTIEVAAWMRDIVAMVVDDGVEFDLSEMRTDPIREGDPYPGLRVHATAYVATAKVPMNIDVNFGDPIVPEPVAVSYPSLLGDPFPILAYPLTAVLGEKIETMVRRGAANTRDRDFADVVMLSRLHPVDGDEMLSSLRATASHRETDLVPLSEALGALVDNRRGAWAPIRRRLGLEDDLSADFAEVVAEVVRFAEPLLTGDAAGRTWNPGTGRWI